MRKFLIIGICVLFFSILFLLNGDSGILSAQKVNVENRFFSNFERIENGDVYDRVFDYADFNFGGGSGFYIEPYFTDLTKESAYVNWVLKKKEKSVFEYGLDKNYGQKILLDEALIHHLYLENLEKGSKYYFKVDNRYEGEFETDLTDSSFDFVAFGHTEGTKFYDHYPDGIQASFIESLGPDFILNMGDNTYFANIHGFKEYFFDEFRNLFAEIPVYLSPGNHDLGWPFLNGVDLGVFCSLFDYSSLDGLCDGELFAYKKEFGDIRMIFFSYYVEDGVALKKLSNYLDENLSDDKFNILIYGGGGALRFDQEIWFEFFKKNYVDLVINGDVIGRGFYVKNGIPVYVVGASKDEPAYVMYARYKYPYLVVQIVNVMGEILDTQMFSVLKGDVFVEEIEAFDVKDLETKMRISFNVEDILKIEKHRLLNVEFDASNEGEAYVYYYLKNFGPEGLRTQHLPIKEGYNQLHFNIVDPVKEFGLDAKISEIKLILLKNGEKVEFENLKYAFY